VSENIVNWQKADFMGFAWIFAGFSSEKSGIFFGKKRDDIEKNAW